MKERGVIMREWEVQAIQEGRKTVFRRLVKFDIENDGDYYRGPKTGMVWFNHREFCNKFCTYGQIGDRLYVRETCLLWKSTDGNLYSDLETGEIYYKDSPEYEKLRADGQKMKKAGTGCFWKVVPSIHMPKWAARIWLEITDIRVERVQDISNDQSGEEGMTYLYDYYRSKIGDFDETLSDRDLFEITWDSVYNNWNDNPWVWVIEFKRIEQ